MSRIPARGHISKTDFGLTPANHIKNCNIKHVQNYFGHMVLPNLKRYLNFLPSSRSELRAQNKRKYLDINIRIYWED